MKKTGYSDNDSLQNGSENLTGPKPEGFLIVGLGASAGGIQALMDFFEHVPAHSGMAYVVILHLSPNHDSKLAEVLQVAAKMPVSQVTEQVLVQPNHVYVVPPDQHLMMANEYITVSPNMGVEDRRAPVDIFFRTLGDSHGQRAVCVILSGTGANGSMGLKRVKEKGGAAFVQNPREAEFNEMPRHAIATGLVDDVSLVAAIPAKIIAYKESLRTVHISEEAADRPDDQQKALREVFTQLRFRTGQDFSNYKRPTLLRRIERRLNIHNLPDLPSYTALMKEQPEEITNLLKDLLISVTNFFRDRGAFEELEKRIIPSVFRDKKEDNKVRIWVAGCATGEEAYSIAMLCCEQMDYLTDKPKVLIFATDIDESAISKAREGLYTINDAADISPERLNRFFTKEGDSFRICKEVREMILFAHHNFLTDPPFSHLDLVTCRNVLIYLNSTAQERVMETFHFALNPGGFLFLGTSESIDGAGDLYAVFSRENHIYQSRQASSRTYVVPETVPSLRHQEVHRSVQALPEAQSHAMERITMGELHQRLLEQYAPPSILVNEDHDIIHLSEKAGRYLQISGGEPTQNLLKLIRQDLRLELRSALYQATSGQMAVEARGLKTSGGEGIETINLQVRPVLEEANTARGFILVMFEPAAAEPTDKNVVLISDEPVARRLEEELIRLKVQLRSSNEQHEIQAEELRASNEELQALNEELRSSTEELETSKEELQSINEELTTVNQELKVKVEEISMAGNNLQNLINSTNIGTIFLDRSFRVILSTPAAREIFNLIPADFGRPLHDITNKIGNEDIIQDAELVLEKLITVEREVHTKDGCTFLMRVLPYRTLEDRIQGVVLTFVNITSIKQAQEALRKSEARLRVTMESAIDFAIITLDKEGKIDGWSRGAERILGYSATEAIGQPGHIIFTPEDIAEGVPEREMLTARKEGRAIDERWHKRRDGTLFYMSGVTTPTQNTDTLSGYVKIARDMTEKRQAEESLRISEERYRLALQSAEMGAWDWDLINDTIIWNEQLCKMMGVEPNGNKTNGAYFLQFIYPDDAEWVRNVMTEAVERKDTFRIEFRIKRADGDIRWMNGYSRTVAEQAGQASRIVGVMYDVTERKKLEQQKDEFIGIASHELKTPVTSIKAYGQIISDKFEKDNDHINAQLMRKLNAQVDRLTYLIRDLLDTTKISEGQLLLHLENVDLNKLILESIEDLQRISTKHHIIWQPQNEDYFITADRERIGQVLVNLISNAIKYSPIGGEIFITTKEEKDNVCVSIKDTGIGIPDDMQSQIFERFFRAHNSQIQSFSGMGLGLYISAGIVHRHGGTISVMSKLGEGSVFSFTLPLDKKNQAVK